MNGTYQIRVPEFTFSNPSTAPVIPAGLIAYFIGAVPAGWTDITGSYTGRYIRGGAPENAGQLLAAEGLRHSHTGRTTGTNGQSANPLRTSDHINYAHTRKGANRVFSNGRRNEPEHTHSGSVETAGGSAKFKPVHAVLRLGRKD